MIAEEMGKIEMDYDCRGGRGDRGSRNGNWNSNDKWQQLQKRAQPKMPQIIGTKRYKRETKNCNGKCAGRSGGRGVASSKNRETRQIAQSVQ